MFEEENEYPTEIYFERQKYDPTLYAMRIGNDDGIFLFVGSDKVQYAREHHEWYNVHITDQED